MRLFFSNSAPEAICLFLSFVRATKIDEHSPTRPSVSLSPDIRLRNGSGACPGGQSNLTITIQNNQETSLFFYITGRDPDANSNFIVLRRQDDCYTWSTKPAYADSSSTMPYYFVNTTNEGSEFHSKLEVNGSASFMLPSYVNSARLYVSQEKLRFGTNVGGPSDGFVEPSSTNKALPEYNVTWQFIEFTYGKGNFILNPSYVDFAAMSLDLTVKSATAEAGGYRVQGLEPHALDKICSDLEKQTEKDNQSWANMCLTDDAGNYLRAISPNQYLALYPNDKMSTYYDEYVNNVWKKYRGQNLTINTQNNGSGIKVDQGRKFTCSVQPDDMLWCGSADWPSGDYTFRKPTTSEIMGCVQGTQDQSSQYLSPFTVTGGGQSLIVPRLCAAFTRSTLLLEDGHIQPNSKITADYYYNDTITNHYSRIIHERLINHTGYAFAYDDTNPASDQDTTSNAGGVIQDADPWLLSVTVR